MSDAVVEQLRRQTIDWLEAHQWLEGTATAEDVAKWRFCELAALMFPQAPQKTKLQASLWTHLVAGMDDACEAEPSITSTLRGRLTGTLGERDVWLKALRSLSVEIGERELSWTVHIQHWVLRVLDGYDWENRWRGNDTPPPSSEYDHWRWLSGGVPVYGAILARSLGMSVVDFSFVTPQSALQAAGTLACMTNDELSVTWDEASKNPINAARIAKGVDYSSWKAQWQQRLQTSRHTPSAYAWPEYYDALDAFTEGTLAWMALTHRYG